MENYYRPTAITFYECQFANGTDASDSLVSSVTLLEHQIHLVSEANPTPIALPKNATLLEVQRCPVYRDALVLRFINDVNDCLGVSITYTTEMKVHIPTGAVSATLMRYEFATVKKICANPPQRALCLFRDHQHFAELDFGRRIESSENSERLADQLN